MRSLQHSCIPLISKRKTAECHQFSSVPSMWQAGWSGFGTKPLCHLRVVWKWPHMVMCNSLSSAFQTERQGQMLEVGFWMLLFIFWGRLLYISDSTFTDLNLYLANSVCDERFALSEQCLIYLSLAVWSLLVCLIMLWVSCIADLRLERDSRKGPQVSSSVAECDLSARINVFALLQAFASRFKLIYMNLCLMRGKTQRNPTILFISSNFLILVRFPWKYLMWSQTVGPHCIYTVQYKNNNYLLFSSGCIFYTYTSVMATLTVNQLTTKIISPCFVLFRFLSPHLWRRLPLKAG